MDVHERVFFFFFSKIFCCAFCVAVPFNLDGNSFRFYLGSFFWIDFLVIKKRLEAGQLFRQVEGNSVD